MINELDKQNRRKGSWPLAWLAITILLPLFGAFLAWNAYDDYGKTLTQEYRTLENQARLGDVQIAGALRNMNLVLQSVIDDTQAMPKLPSKVIEQRQLSLLRQFPEIHFLITVDHQGQVTSAEGLDDPDDLAAVRSFNASERDYFTGHRDAKPDDYYRYQLSRPFKTITNRYTITISKAIRGKNGQFQGVALISLSPSYFDSVLQQVLSNDVLDAAAVHNRFGDIIYRLPNPEMYIGKNIAGGSAFKSYLGSEQQLTRYQGVTATDSVNRILVFSKVGDTNLDIGVSGQFDVVMAKWRSDVLMKGLIFFIVSVLAFTLAWVAQRHLRERELAMEALRESQRIANLGGWSIDLASGHLTWTDETFLIHELPVGEPPTVEQAINYYLPDSRKVIEQAVTEALENGKSFDLELQIKTARGNVRWVHARGEARQEARTHSVIAGTFQDISKRKQVEEMLLTIMKAVESTGEAIGISDGQGRHFYQNKAASDLFGYVTAEEFEAAGGGRAVIKDPQVVKDMFDNIMGGKSWEGELEMVAKNGRVFPAYERADAIKDNQGKIIGLVGIIKDITERKQLDAERNRLLKIIDDAKDFISTSDMQGHIMSLNAEGARMVGLPDDVDIAALDIKDFHPEWAARKIAEEAIPAVLKNGSWQGECALLRRDGHEIPTSQMVQVHRDVSGKPLYMSTIIRDVTERKQAEIELKRSNSELEQFSYAISHDMRQPLRMIASYLQLLDKELGGTLDAERREYMNFAVNGAKRLDQMLIGLLEYSRIGRMGEPPGYVESRELLDEALLFLHPAIVEAEADIRIQGHWPEVFVSQDEMLRLLQNLIGNSIKFRVAQRKPEITVTSETTASEWRVCVADNGVGILPGQLGRLFQVFQRLHSRSDYEGTGIGLALCRKIVEHHGGQIWAESAGAGQGSQFCFTVPQRKSEQEI
ncbi:MAG: PAS domain S-box protein [Sterolibacterium sp.]